MSIARDEAWIAEARARAAGGYRERDPEEIFADLKETGAELAAERPPEPKCPYCVDHPELQRFQRFELLTVDPLRICQQCHGFWAVGDALARGVADPGSHHPALDAVPAPRRCRACFGHLKPDHTCVKCGQPVPMLDCPGCGKQMERIDRRGVLLDSCPTCHGTWFDIGEIAAVYSLAPVQGLAASTVDEHAADDEPPAWLLAAQLLGRLVVPFLPI